MALHCKYESKLKAFLVTRMRVLSAGKKVQARYKVKFVNFWVKFRSNSPYYCELKSMCHICNVLHIWDYLEKIVSAHFLNFGCILSNVTTTRRKCFQRRAYVMDSSFISCHQSRNTAVSGRCKILPKCNEK